MKYAIEYNSHHDGALKKKGWVKVSHDQNGIYIDYPASAEERTLWNDELAAIHFVMTIATNSRDYFWVRNVG